MEVCPHVSVQADESWFNCSGLLVKMLDVDTLSLASCCFKHKIIGQMDTKGSLFQTALDT
eukprot:1159282-Pelagomonas_calceolata.AAC.10